MSFLTVSMGESSSNTASFILSGFTVHQPGSGPVTSVPNGMSQSQIRIFVGSFRKKQSFHICKCIYIYYVACYYCYCYYYCMYVYIYIYEYQHISMYIQYIYTCLHYRVIASIFPCKGIADFTGHLLWCNNLNFLPLPDFPTSTPPHKQGKRPFFTFFYIL